MASVISRLLGRVYAGDMTAEPSRSDEEAFDALWDEFAEVDRLLQETDNPRERLGLEKKKEALRIELATLGDAVVPPKSAQQVRDELQSWERRLAILFDKRINVTTQSSGDGASPGGSGVGALQINEAIDSNLGRAEIEQNIRRLRAELAKAEAASEA